LQIKGLLKLPAKKAENKNDMNQQLSGDCAERIAVGTPSVLMAHRSTSFVHK
jgi:hypothetical protein